MIDDRYVGDQWDTLAASGGPEGDVSAIANTPRMTWRQGFTGKEQPEEIEPTVTMPVSTYHEHINGSVRSGKRLGRLECVDTHKGMLAAAYRAGELAGLVKMGAVVGALWALSWALGGRNRG